MEISKDIELIDLALYLKKKKVLIISDTHIGQEEALEKQGVLLPRMQFKDIVKRIEKIFSEVSPKIIVINGDIKHEFGSISDQEWRDALRIVDIIEKR